MVYSASLNTSRRRRDCSAVLAALAFGCNRQTSNFINLNKFLESVFNIQFKKKMILACKLSLKLKNEESKLDRFISQRNLITQLPHEQRPGHGHPRNDVISSADMFTQQPILSAFGLANLFCILGIVVAC